MTGFGVGGNLPVDGALFLEFLPGSHQYLLTLLSLWWAVGQVVASLISWAFLAKWGCTPRKSVLYPPIFTAPSLIISFIVRVKMCRRIQLLLASSAPRNLIWVGGMHTILSVPWYVQSGEIFARVFVLNFFFRTRR